jgi:HK97 family phage major capsid protein
VLADEIREWGRNFDCPEVATAYLRENAGQHDLERGIFRTRQGQQAGTVQVPQHRAAEAPVKVHRESSSPAPAALRHAKISPARTQPSEHIALASGSSPHAVSSEWPLGRGRLCPGRTVCTENGIAMTRAMSEGVNESGGFLVPEEFGNDLIDLREIYGVFRRNAKMVPMSSDTRSRSATHRRPDRLFRGRGRCDDRLGQSLGPRRADRQKADGLLDTRTSSTRTP